MYQKLKLVSVCVHKSLCVCVSHQRYVAVVPGVVVYQRGTVSHACYLVAVVPPGHDSSVLLCVLTQPIVGLPEVIQNVPGPGEEEEGGRGGGVERRDSGRKIERGGKRVVG